MGLLLALVAEEAADRLASLLDVLSRLRRASRWRWRCCIARAGRRRAPAGVYLLPRSSMRTYEEAERELLTGYDILTRQTSPSVSWLKTAREDLVKLYSASNQPEKAKKFRSTP